MQLLCIRTIDITRGVESESVESLLRYNGVGVAFSDIMESESKYFCDSDSNFNYIICKLFKNESK